MSRRGLLIALIVSLAVNLFVLGGLAGAAIMGALHRHGPPPQGGPPRLSALGADLSPEHRKAWDAAVRQAVRSYGPELHQAHEIRRQAWQGLANDPVDPQAAIASLDHARTLEFQVRAAMDRAVVGFAATLPTDQRRKLCDALSQPRMHRPHGRWSGHDPAAGGRHALPHR